MSLLPNAELAYVPEGKLIDYALNPDHPVGKHKAAVFKAVLDISRNKVAFLKDSILKAVLTQVAIPTRLDKFGQRYQVEFVMERYGRTATIITAWILEHSEQSPRLTSCYVK